MTASGRERRAGAFGISCWPILLVMMLAELTSVMEAAMTYAALPTFYRLYQNPIAIGWLYTAFLLVAGAAAGVCGALGDRFDRRVVLIGVLAISTIGSLISTVGLGIGWIIAGRALQGVSLAILPLTLGLLRERMPEQEVPVGIGFLMIMASAAGAACFVLGGAIVDHLNWHWIFGITAAVTVFALLCVVWTVPAQTSRSAGSLKGIDWIGGTLYAPGVMLVLLAISQAPVSGWTSPLILLSIGIGLIILAGWVVWELRHRAPLIDIRLMLTRQSAFALLAYALLGIGPFQFGLTVYALLSEPAWAGAGFGLTATMAGVLNLPSATLGCFSGPLSGMIAKARGGRMVLLISTATYAAGWIGIAISHGLVGVALSIMVIGIAAPMGYTAIASVLVEATPEDRTSEVLGIAEVVRAMAMAIGSQVMAVILAGSTVSRLGEGVFPSAAAHHLTFYLTIATCLGAFALALLIPRRAVGSTGASAA